MSVLKKSVNRNLANVKNIDNSKPVNYLVGVFKLFGMKGCVLILLMIALGFLLRYLRTFGFDTYNIMAYLYLGVALAILLASRFYFRACLKHKS